ncbi:MAG: hypothetical protein AAF125_09630 [Chloroflexota bacterium]
MGSVKGDDAQTSGVSYTRLAGNVHRLTFYRADRLASDEALSIYRRILKGHDPTVPLKLLVDTRKSGVPSVRYLFSGLRSLYRWHNGTLPEIHVAYLYQDAIMLTMARPLLELLKVNATREYFLGSAYDEALEWVRTQASSARR